MGHDAGGALERGTQCGAFPDDLAERVGLGFQVRQRGSSEGGATTLYRDGEGVA